MPMRSARAALLALLSIALAGTLAGSLGHDAAAAERRGQCLFLPAALSHRSAVQEVHRGDRHQGQCDLCRERPDRAHGGGGAEQPCRCPAHRGCRQSDPGEGRRHRPVTELEGTRGGDPGGLSRQRRHLVGAHPPRPRRLRLEGPGEAGSRSPTRSSPIRNGAARSASAPASMSTTWPSSPR